MSIEYEAEAVPDEVNIDPLEALIQMEAAAEALYTSNQKFRDAFTLSDFRTGYIEQRLENL